VEFRRVLFRSVPSVRAPPFPAAIRHAPRLGPAASSRTPLARPATACSAPLAQPERTGLTVRRVILHRTASEPLDPSSPGTGVLVRIDQRNRCTLARVAHRQVTRQGFPCAAPLRIGRRHDGPTRTSNPWFSSPNLEPRRLEE